MESKHSVPNQLSGESAQRTHSYRVPPPLLVMVGVTLALGLTLIVFYGVVRPPLRDVTAMAASLSVTTAISLALAYAAYRLKWANRVPILWAFVGGYGLVGILVLLNVLGTAVLMFVSQHDLVLAAVLLFFATEIAILGGYFISLSVMDQIMRLGNAAAAIARGQLDMRLAVEGRGELAELGEAFNDMAAQLESMSEKQRQLEAVRRDLVAWISHDLRTPLASARATIEAVADGVAQDPAVAQRYLRMAQYQVQALSRLTDDLFELAQVDAGGYRMEREPTSLSDLISDVIARFSPQAEQRGLVLKGSATGLVDPIMIDASRIERVLTNLIDNAMRHTPFGGTVEINASALDGEVRVEVCDTGEGIDATDLPHIFEQFYRGQESSLGRTGRAGLGLAIALSIVEAHGGEIGATSSRGEGTCVWFTLPR